MHKKLIVLVALFAFVATACSANLERNADGSFRLEVGFTEEAIAEQIALSLADAKTRNLNLDLKRGYIAVTGQSERANSSKTDDLSFTLTLGVTDGHLSAVIANAVLNDLPIAQSRVDAWNANLAENLSKSAQKNENSTLVEVITTEQDVTFVYRIETRQSRGN